MSKVADFMKPAQRGKPKTPRSCGTYRAARRTIAKIKYRRAKKS